MVLYAYFVMVSRCGKSAPGALRGRVGVRRGGDARDKISWTGCARGGCAVQDVRGRMRGTHGPLFVEIVPRQSKKRKKCPAPSLHRGQNSNLERKCPAPAAKLAKVSHVTKPLFLWYGYRLLLPSSAFKVNGYEFLWRGRMSGGWMRGTHAHFSSRLSRAMVLLMESA